MCRPCTMGANVTTPRLHTTLLALTCMPVQSHTPSRAVSRTLSSCIRVYIEPVAGHTGSNEGGPQPVPLSERTHDRTRGSNKSMGHTLGSVTERPQKNNAESMVPSLPSLGPREGGVLITALDAKAMKLHPVRGLFIHPPGRWAYDGTPI